NQLLYVKENYDIDVLAIRDVPRYSFNVLESLESYGVDKTTQKMNSENNQQDEEAWQNLLETNTNLFKVDLTEYFMSDNEFQPIIGNVIIYRDNRHMTNSFSKTFGPIFEEE